MCYYNLYAIKCCLNFIIFFIVLLFYSVRPSNLHNILVNSDRDLDDGGGGDDGGGWEEEACGTGCNGGRPQGHKRQLRVQVQAITIQRDEVELHCYDAG